MINLLSSNVKKDIQYARRNTVLLRWCLVLLLITIGIGIISISGVFYIRSSQRQYSDQIAHTDSTLKEQKLAETQKNIENISNNLKLTVQVLSKEILFSKLFKQIGAVMPPDTYLTDLKISDTEGGIDLSAAAKSYNSATQVQVNLQDPSNKIFDKADIITVGCTTTVKTNYPCTISLRARFGNNHDFFFINSGAKQ